MRLLEYTRIVLTENNSLYGVRKLLTLYYDYRTSKNQTYLDGLIKERDTTIDKLKAATKYDSTQQLIDKYSSNPSPPQKEPGDDGKKKAASGQHGHGPGLQVSYSTLPLLMILQILRKSVGRRCQQLCPHFLDLKSLTNLNDSNCRECLCNHHPQQTSTVDQPINSQDLRPLSRSNHAREFTKFDRLRPLKIKIDEI